MQKALGQVTKGNQGTCGVRTSLRNSLLTCAGSPGGVLRVEQSQLRLSGQPAVFGSQNSTVGSALSPNLFQLTDFVTGFPGVGELYLGLITCDGRSVDTVVAFTDDRPQLLRGSPRMGNLFTRAAAIVAGLALTATGVVTADLPAAAADSGCSATFKSYSTIRAGSTGAKAKAMECLLSEAGFATTVNGKFSKTDAKELASFRKSVGLSPIKSGGRKAWSALLAQGETPALKSGDTGADVQASAALAAGRQVQDPGPGHDRQGHRQGDQGGPEAPQSEGHRQGRRQALECPAARPDHRAVGQEGRQEVVEVHLLARRQGPGLRPQAAGRALPLRRRRPQRLGLLRPDHEGLEGRRQEACRTARAASSSGARRSPSRTCARATWSSSTPASATSGSTPATARSSTPPAPASRSATSR